MNYFPSADSGPEDLKIQPRNEPEVFSIGGGQCFVPVEGCRSDHRIADVKPMGKDI